MDSSALTEKILTLRKETDAFQQSINSRSEKLSYTFYDGPPFTSGDPHYGHLLQSIVKDMVPRRMTMRGYRVNRKWGWDCHGIPAENFVNKKLGITSKKQVEEEFGLQNYIEACRSMVNQVNDNRKWTVDRIWRWVDMENAYFTMDNDYMESVICLFSDLYHRNLIYKWFKVLWYSRALWTALSNSEIAEGYEMRQDPAVTVKFPLKNNTDIIGTNFLTTHDDGAVEVVVWVLKDEQGRVLMIFKNRDNVRYFPWGKIEHGENPADALKREILEELWVEVTSEVFLWHAKTVHRSKIYRLHYFQITVDGVPSIQQPQYHGMMEWVQKVPSENDLGYVLKFADLIIADAKQLRHDFADIHMLEDDLIGQEGIWDTSVSILPWTTTPWTLPANMFAAVHRDIWYIQVFDKTTKEYYILAEQCLPKYYKSADEYVEVTMMKWGELLDILYTPLFDYYHVSTDIEDVYKKQVHKILHADFVTTDSGTGIVHEAPAFGADDYELIAGVLGKDNAQAWLFDPVNEHGEFTTDAPDFAGQNVIEANSSIIKELKSRWLLVRQETINHSYPHCPRTKTPLIYKAIESWFVKEEELKALTVPAAEQIHFVPENVKQRFINGLQSAPDRNISRTRFWWAPLPVWECGDCESVDVVWSIAEIETKSGQKVNDLHRPYIDQITFPCACGGVKHRIPEVLDCWFESGSMPYGQDHFMKQENDLTNFNCANFIAEWLDQTRGWFRALHVLGHAYHQQNVFQNVVVTGMILAEDGKKMSKSLQNYPDPKILINQYGADALRLYLLSSPVVRSEPLRFSEKGVEQMLKDVIIPLQNVFNFFKMYAEADQWKDNWTQVRFMRHALKQQKWNDTWDDGETLGDLQLPLSESGFAQLTSPDFIEQVVRIDPEVIICSDFLRAQQTAKWVQNVLREYLNKEIEVEITPDRWFGARPDKAFDAVNTHDESEYTHDAKEISVAYQELLQKHAGKRILIVSHKRRFRYLWQWLFDIQEDMHNLDATKKYMIQFEQPVSLPLTQVNNELDQWVLAELHRTAVSVSDALSHYNIDEATIQLMSFIDNLTNRYLRRSRRRFWTEEMNEDKQQAYLTLYTVLRTYLQLCAPFIPFVTEQLRQELGAFTSASQTHPSIHLQSRPVGSSLYINQDLISEIETVRKIIKWALYLRAKHQVKVKQPLPSLSFRV